VTTFNIDIAKDGYAKTINTEEGPIDTWVDTYAVLATTPRGDVWALADNVLARLEGDCDLERAQAMLAGLDHDPATQPDLWLPCDPVYGSEAWDDEALAYAADLQSRLMGCRAGADNRNAEESSDAVGHAWVNGRAIDLGSGVPQRPVRS
jgi:hypothetical protein